MGFLFGKDGTTPSTCRRRSGQRIGLIFLLAFASTFFFSMITCYHLIDDSSTCYQHSFLSQETILSSSTKCQSSCLPISVKNRPLSLVCFQYGRISKSKDISTSRPKKFSNIQEYCQHKFLELRQKCKGKNFPFILSSNLDMTVVEEKEAVGVDSQSIAKEKNLRNESAFAPKMALCKNCKNYFNREENHDRACVYHPKPYSGDSARKADWSNVKNRGSVVKQYWCCGEPDFKHPGCKYDRHRSYDD